MRNIRNKSESKQILTIVGILLLGICLGTFSKYLDYHQAHLPGLLQIMDDTFDVHNFLGGFSPWILIAVCISVYSQSPFRAAVHVFTFFAGMVSSYYLYCSLVAGFFPRSYAMIWVGFTIASPFLASLCWYAKGKRIVALILSAGITGVLINTAFAYGMFYVDVRSWLDVLMLLIGILVLRRPAEEMPAMIGVGVIMAIVTDWILPFSVW